MPAVSKAQYRLMRMVAKGKHPSKNIGISREKALEFVQHQSPKGLPERVGKKKGKKR